MTCEPSLLRRNSALPVNTLIAADEDFALSLRTLLRDWPVQTVSTYDGAVTALESFSPAAVIIHHSWDGAVDLVRHIHTRGAAGTIIISITGEPLAEMTEADEKSRAKLMDIASEALRSGPLFCVTEKHSAHIRDFFARLQPIEETTPGTPSFYQRVLNTVPLPVYVYDLKQEYSIYSNPAALQFADMSREEVEDFGGAINSEIMHADDLARQPERAARYANVSDNETMESRVRLRDADGRWRHMLSQDRVFARDGNGSPRLIAGVTQDITEIHDHAENLRGQRELGRKLLSVSEGERRRIGRNLHDNLGQLLSGIAYLAESLEQRLAESGQDSACSLATKISETLRRAIDETRENALSLYPLQLDAASLPDNLADLASRYERFYGTPCRVQCPGDLPLSAESALHLYYIAADAVDYCVAARTERINARIKQAGDHLELEICAFQARTDTEPSQSHQHELMLYRAEMIGAQLSFRKQAHDLCVVCTVPMQANSGGTEV